MPGWLVDLLVNLAAAFSGVLGGLQSSEWLARRKTKARRDVLVAVLRQEIERYAPHPRRNMHVAPAMDHWPTPTDIVALDLLLSDDSLDPHKDARLIGLLVRFKTSTVQLNENVHEAHGWGQGDDERGTGHQEQLMQQYMVWLAWRDAVIRELDDRTYGSGVTLASAPEPQPAPLGQGPGNPPQPL